LVVIHDATLQRTTDGIGEVCEIQWRSIASLDAGSWLVPHSQLSGFLFYRTCSGFPM
jgi:glycerophosphoryl diester phosphodiesterase